MEYGYGIQKLSDEEINQKAFNEKKLIIQFENIESIDPQDYERDGKGALQAFNDFCNNGALIAVDYSTIDKSNMHIGIVPKGSQISSECLNGIWSKSIQLKDVKMVPYSDYPILNALKPIKLTTCRWRRLDKRLEFIYEGKDLPFEVGSLLPEQLEIICLEYLKMFKILHVPILKPGGSQSKIDIAGIGVNEKRIFAQVSNIITKNKMNDLLTFLNQDCLLFYFGPKEEKNKLPDGTKINFISIEKVFDILAIYPCSSLYLMLKQMLTTKSK